MTSSNANSHIWSHPEHVDPELWSTPIEGVSRRYMNFVSLEMVLTLTLGALKVSLLTLAPADEAHRLPAAVTSQEVIVNSSTCRLHVSHRASGTPCWSYCLHEDTHLLLSCRLFV